MDLFGSPARAFVRGNYIGTDITGAAPLPNEAHGVLITAGSHQNEIGGTISQTPGACTGYCNVIAFNSASGVRVDSVMSVDNSISANRVFANSSLGIDLGPAGVTANDPGDGDTGANQLQNFPVLTSASFDGVNTTISGSLSSQANTTFTVDIFSNEAVDPSGHGQGRIWLGSTTVATNSVGDGSFTMVVPGEARFPTATATSPTGNTSEFSASFSNPGEASPAGNMTAAKGTGTQIQLSYTPACGASDHAAFRGVAGPAPISGGLVWTGASCGLGVSGNASIDPGSPTAGRVFYFVIVGQIGSSEGSYGRSSAGVERAEALGIGSCDLPQKLTISCP